MKKLIAECSHFSFYREKQTRRGIPHKQSLYIISFSPERRSPIPELLRELEEVRDFIDPNRNISGHSATCWKFKKRAEAEKIWTYLVLRWG